MLLRFSACLIFLALLLVPISALGGQPSSAEPRYDPATTTAVEGVVTATRETARSAPMPGLHLLVDTGKETLDVYLGPMEFMKSFDFTFGKGDRIDAVGSRVKVAGGTVILAREVRRQSQTVYLRGPDGSPYWTPGS